MKDILHESARLSAVVQCWGVCEATALAQRSGGQQSRQLDAADRSVVSSRSPWLLHAHAPRHVSKKTTKTKTKTAEQPNSRTAEQPNSRTAEQPNNRTTEQPNNRTTATVAILAQVPRLSKAWP